MPVDSIDQAKCLKVRVWRPLRGFCAPSYSAVCLCLRRRHRDTLSELDKEQDKKNKESEVRLFPKSLSISPPLSLLWMGDRSGAFCDCVCACVCVFLSRCVCISLLMCASVYLCVCVCACVFGSVCLCVINAESDAQRPPVLNHNAPHSRTKQT